MFAGSAGSFAVGARTAVGRRGCGGWVGRGGASGATAMVGVGARGGTVKESWRRLGAGGASAGAARAVGSGVAVRRVGAMRWGRRAAAVRPAAAAAAAGAGGQGLA
jgi:hypothetical protein